MDTMNKTNKDKSLELIEFFKPLVYCYIGSGMLSDDYDEKIVLENAKKCAIKCVSEILLEWSNETGRLGKHKYWEEVLNEIKLL